MKHYPRASKSYQWLLLLLLNLFFFACKTPKTPPVRFSISILDEREIVRVEEKDSLLTPIFKDEKVNQIFGKYKVTRFEQSYPSSRFPYLKAVYEIEANSTSLMNELPEVRPDLFFDPVVLEEVKYLAHTPNDFGLATNGQGDLDWIGMRDAWDITKGHPSNIIGITDQGFDVNHPDLSGKIVNVRSNSSVPGHGTPVASVAAAATNNSLGISGAGYNCSLDLSLSGLGNVLAMSADGIRVINNSWFSNCTPYPNPEGVCHEIYENGSVTTWGAGNGYQHCQFNETYPPAYPHNLSITSVGSEVPYGQMSSWQGSGGPIPWNWQDVHWNVVGRTAAMSDGTTQMTEIHNHNPSVDLCAPGYHVRVATAPGNGYFVGGHGTSFAAPMVAGVIALMQEVNPCLSPYQIEVGLKTTAVNIDQIPENQQFAGGLGSGRADARAAVLWAQNQPCNDAGTATMVIPGVEFNTLCRPGQGSTVIPRLTPQITNGVPPYSALWTPLPGNTATLTSNTDFDPEVTFAFGNGRVHFRVRITDSSPVPKVAVKIVDLQLTNNQFDLAMRDSYTDPLGEPNRQIQIDPRDWSIWQSPDVWNRQTQDGLTTHENPEFFISSPNFAYARVRNIGCADNPPGSQLRLYWSKASTGEDWDQDWTSTNVIGTNGTQQPGGREITQTPIPIPVIPPGGEWIVSRPWNPVRPQDYAANLNSVDVCFLARIEETPNAPHGMAFPEVTLVKENITNNNNVVSRNFVVNNHVIGNKVAVHEVLFANPQNERRSFDLEIIADRQIHPQLSEDILSSTSVQLDLAQVLERWQKGGGLGEYPEGSLKGTNLTFDGRSIRLNNILLNPGEKLPLTISIQGNGPTDIPLRFHLRQFETGNDEVLYGAVSFETMPEQK